uniref:Hydroperoxide isomerase ALOXE3-like n=1 Tax=Stegastes partitus TaxID=144197 RepID=A0A3B4Z3X0_9TELE
MVKYVVSVYTGYLASGTTLNNIHIKLVGTDGESDHEWLKPWKGALTFAKGFSSSFYVCCPTSLGKLVLIEVDKQRLPLFPEDSWFPAKVEVKSPDGDTYNFPIYRWITDNTVHRFREGTALRVFDDTHHLGRYSRQQELKQREEDYRWSVYAEGMPHCIKVDNPLALPCEVRFSFTKTTEFAFTALTGLTELALKGLTTNTKKWKNIDDITKVFCTKQTPISEYVQKHWKEDAFFGYQYLNGVNPMLIRRCKVLPRNFPVTCDKIFLHSHCNLKDEMQVILKQTPADDNPIFFPTDSEYDWLMAKIFVRSADFSEHQLNVHLLRTHLLAEVFAVSLLRNVPMIHPLYKLLIPHTRYTLQINYLARLLLISETGVFTQFAASGGEAMMTILKRSLSEMTYTSLCIPDDIAERGVEDVPNFFYRDDGLKLWDAIHKFVQGLLGHYYKSDAEVQQDTELQKWISDIFEHGFLSNPNTGIPRSLHTVDEMVKYVTMVIFIGSGQHSAVNTGQFDYGGWMPNTPISLQLPPPTTKGTTSEDTMLQTFPDINTTAQGMATMWLLSKQSSDFVALGQHPEDHFSEEIPLKMIKNFQGELEVLSAVIKNRNKGLDVPYTYMDPLEVENSVAI